MNDFSIMSPTGNPVTIPVRKSDKDTYGNFQSNQEIRDYYEKYGYVVIRNVIPPALCNETIKVFNKEVLPFKGNIYRQASASLEKHVYTKGGHMLNSILNVQSLDPKHLSGFRKIGIEVLTANKLQDALGNIFNDAPKLVQSMFFDGNPVTWAHQDTYYLDSEDFNMVGVWFAMEDIDPDAGRFYVYPESHKIDISKNGGNFDIAFNHDRYKKLVVDIINAHKLELRAPALKKGDILIWNSKTIHGCLPTMDIQKSRKSFTGHFIPNGEKFLQYQSRIKPLALKTINGMNVNFPKDLSSFKNRMMYYAELNFPGAFKALKAQMIKRLTK